MTEPVPPEWPWPRLFLLSFGSGLAMVGTYVMIFRLFEIGFDVDTGHLSREPLVWGAVALVAGVVLLGAPWFPSAPWWRERSD